MIDLKSLTTVRARLKYRATQKAKYFQIKLFKSSGKKLSCLSNYSKELKTSAERQKTPIQTLWN